MKLTGSLRSPLCRDFMKPLAWVCSEAPSLGASQSLFPRALPDPYLGFHEASCLGASHDPFLGGFMNPLNKGLQKALALVLHKSSYLGGL